MDKILYKSTDIPTRALVVTLKGLEKMSSQKISEITGLNSRTVDRIYKKARDRGFDPTVFPVQLSVEHLEDSVRTGRISKRTDEFYDAMMNKINKREEEGKKAYNCFDLSQELKQEGFDVSKTTVWRALQNQRFKPDKSGDEIEEDTQGGKMRKRKSKKPDDEEKRKKKKRITKTAKNNDENQEGTAENPQSDQHLNEPTNVELPWADTLLEDLPQHNLQGSTTNSLLALEPESNLSEPLPVVDTVKNEDIENQDRAAENPQSNQRLNEPTDVDLSRADTLLEDLPQHNLQDSTTNTPPASEPKLNLSEPLPAVELYSVHKLTEESQPVPNSIKDATSQNTIEASHNSQDSNINSPLTPKPELNLLEPLPETELHNVHESVEDFQHASQSVSNPAAPIKEDALEDIKKTTEASKTASDSIKDHIPQNNIYTAQAFQPVPHSLEVISDNPQNPTQGPQPTLEPELTLPSPLNDVVSNNLQESTSETHPEPENELH